MPEPIQPLLPEEQSPDDPQPRGTPPIPAAMWKRILTEVRKEVSREIRDDDEFDDEANSIAIGLIVLGLLVGAFFLIRPLFREKPVNPVYTKLEAIKHIRELTLVKQHYTTLIPITRKGRRAEDESLEFLLRAPVQVYGSIDLSRVNFEVQPDSLITVLLPRPTIAEPYIDIENTTVFNTGKSLFERLSGRFFTRNTRYLDAYDQIRTALDSASNDVLRKALINDIEDETLNQSEIYLRSLIGSLGYRVQFVRSIEIPADADSSTLNRLQRQLLERELNLPDIKPDRGTLLRRMLIN